MLWNVTVSEMLAEFSVGCAPLDLARTMAPLRQGVADPTLVIEGGTVWRAMGTADGPATLRLRVEGGRLLAAAAGPGASRALERAPRLAGLEDVAPDLRPRHTALREALTRFPGIRLGSGTPVFEVLVWTVLAQRVVGLDARRAYRDLVARLGEPAPGHPAMRLPPRPEVLAATPYWVFHEVNVERRRATVIIEAARRAQRLDALADLPAAEAAARLRSLPGVGEWTGAEVVAASHGDPDAVPRGDFHLPNLIASALAGEPRGGDDRMLELLEPYRGQRGRVIRLLLAGGRHAPRRGPPMPRRTISRL